MLTFIRSTILGALMCVPLLAADTPQPVRPGVSISMPDQFDDRHNLGAYKGHVVVLLYGDKAGAKRNKQLGEALHVHYHPTAKGVDAKAAAKAEVSAIANWQGASPNVYVIPVACIGKVPDSVKFLIRRGFKSDAPDVPVWPDFENTMKDTLGMREDQPNLIVIDKDGKLAWRAMGEPDEKTWKRLVEVVDFLRTEKK